jgi:hypothetical protein
MLCERFDLERVLDVAMSILAPGGRIVVGDVRNHRTLRAFTEAVYNAKRPENRAAAVQAAIERAVLDEKELVIDPAFFVQWAEARPDIAATDVRLKQGAAHNELTRHRYEVVLHRGPVQVLDLADLPMEIWGVEANELFDVTGALARHGGKIRLVRVPNARLVTEKGELGGQIDDRGALDPADHFEAVVVPDVDATVCDGICRAGRRRAGDPDPSGGLYRAPRTSLEKGRRAADPHRGGEPTAVVAAPRRRSELALHELRQAHRRVVAALRHPGARLRRDHSAAVVHRGDDQRLRGPEAAGIGSLADVMGSGGIG